LILLINRASIASKLTGGHALSREWQEFLAITGSGPLVVERVRLLDKDIAIEGRFELPPLARLAPEEQVFVMAFVRCHGSIKKMEELFGVSYPTIKNRLNRIAEQFQFVELSPAPSSSDVLARLERGEISVQEALEMLRR